jgi:hypothetical protein
LVSRAALLKKEEAIGLCNTVKQKWPIGVHALRVCAVTAFMRGLVVIFLRMKIALTTKLMVAAGLG